MKDKIVEHPNRYRLVPVPGESNVFDIVPVPGEVTEEGTAINKANLLSDETAGLFGLADGTVNEALNAIGASPPPFNAYATDLYMYVTGRHPILCAYKESRESYLKYLRPARTIALSGNAESVVVYDGYYF